MQNEIRRVPVLASPVYQEKAIMLEGKDGVAIFKNLQGKVRGGFSWGENPQNMATSLDTDGRALENTREWMGKLHLPSQIIRILSSDTKGPEGNNGVLEVTQEVVDGYSTEHGKGDVTTSADFIYTKDPRFTLMVKPADCPSVIVYAKNKKGEHIVGVGHWGREGVDAMNPMLAMTHLLAKEEEGGEECDPSTIYIGIAPGIGPQYHTLTYEEIIPSQEGLPSKLLHWSRWGNRLTGPDAGPEPYTQKRYHIDLLGRIIDLIDRRIPRNHIEANRQDTYSLAAKGLAFSHRYSLVNKVSEGRMVVAAALPFLL